MNFLFHLLEHSIHFLHEKWLLNRDLNHFFHDYILIYTRSNLGSLNLIEEKDKELEQIKKKMIKDLRDNEFMIDKRVISSVLVNYFDVNATDITKKNLLETLSSIMEYSNDDRQKMGLKPIHIGDTNQLNNGTFKSMSEGLYNFILNG